MFKSLKKAFAVLASVALLATSNAGVAFAQTFDDVATDAWYYDFVESLVADGVIEAKDSFYPKRSLNRAELVKMIIESVDGLAGYKAPASPTFDDVSEDAWYFQYVEAAVQLDIVQGYKDAQGNLTGLFGPTDVVNRAAMTKIVVEANGVPTLLTPASPFSDVAKGAWFHDYVVTAYNQSIIDGYGNGTFGPANPVTRAEAAKIIINGQDPVVRADKKADDKGEDDKGEETKEEEKKTDAKSEGALEVSVNDKTASSSTVPLGSTGVELLSWDFTAADDDVAISNLVVTRGGVGQTIDWEELFLYDGTNRLTTGRSINSDTNTTTFSVNVTVEAGTTKTLRLIGDVAATGTAQPNNQHYFYVASSADVTSNAKSVAGDFPVAGNTFTIGNVSTTSVTISTGSTPSQPKVGGNDQEIAAFRLAAGAANDVALHQVTFTQNGSLSSAKMVNLRLLRGTDEVATAKGFVGDLVTFVLDTPFVIDKGQTKNFYVRADINGGRPDDDTIELYLDESTDLHVIDRQYTFGATVTNQFTTTQTPSLALEGSGVTITDNGPASRQVAQNSNNVAIFDFSVTADRDLTVKDMDLTIRAGIGGNYVDLLEGVGGSDATFANMTTGGGANLRTGFRTDVNVGTGAAAARQYLVTGNVFSVVLGGTTYYCTVTNSVADTTAADVTTDCPSVAAAATDLTVSLDPYQWIENVKIMDIDSGATLQGPVTRWNATTTLVGATTNNSYTKKMTEDYDLIGGETRHLRVAVDFNQNMPSGMEVEAVIDFSTAGYIKDVKANKNVSINDIVGATQTSKRATIKQNSLAVAQTSNVITGKEYVKGSKAVKCAEYSFTAGDAGDITLKKVTVRLYGDDDADFSVPTLNATGDTEAKSFVTSVSLYDGNTLVAGPEALELIDSNGSGFTAGTDYNRGLFDNLKMVVKKGETKTLTAQVDLLSNFSTGTRNLACDMVPGTDIVAEDDDANTITATPSTTHLNRAATPNPVVNIIQSGTLTATSTSGNISPAVLVGGTNDVLVAQYSFSAEREAYNVNKLSIINDLTGAFDSPATTNAVSSVKIVYPDVNGVEKSVSGALTNGSRTFSGLSFHVPHDKTAVLKVYANVRSISGGDYTVSGDSVRIGLREGTTNTSSTFEAVGVASSDTNYFNTATDVKNSSNISAHVVRKAKPVFAKGTQSSTAMPTTGGDLYKFNVTANGGDVSFARFVFDVNTTGLTGTNNDIYDWEFRNTAGVIQNHHIWGVGAIDANDDAVYLKDALLGSGLQNGNNPAGNTVENGLYRVTVTFNDEQIISAGKTETFTLRASINGASTDDTVNVSLAKGDENAPVTGIAANFDNDNGFANTSQLVGAGGTKTSKTLTVGAIPANGETITIGTCIVTFSSAADELNCDDNAANIKRDDAGESTTTIATSIDNLGNITDTAVGSLEVTAGAATTSVVNGHAGAGTIAFTDGTFGDITATNVAGVVDALFTDSALAAVDADNRFFGDSSTQFVTDRNIIWSDRVGSDYSDGLTPGAAVQTNHTYATVAGSSTAGTGAVTDYTGTLDWTNGYLLEVDELSAFSFKK